MSEFERLLGPAPTLDPGQILLTLLLALLLGVVVGLTYRVSAAGRVLPANIQGSLVLLSMVTAMVMMVIGNNIARAFSLVGALAIIRFRTRMRSSWDISFVFLALVVGIACGAQAFSIAILGTAVIVLAILALPPTRLSGVRADCIRRVRCDVAAYEGAEHLVEETLDRHVLRRSLIEARSQRFGEVLSLRYRVVLRDPGTVPALIREVSTLEQVESIVVDSDTAADGEE